MFILCSLIEDLEFIIRIGDRANAVFACRSTDGTKN